MKPKSRTIVMYTPNYGISGYKIVYDSRVSWRFKTPEAAIDCYENKKAEDADIKFIYASANISNEEILAVYNNTMELATSKMMDKLLGNSKK
jgi:hypothetical protein